MLDVRWPLNFYDFMHRQQKELWSTEALGRRKVMKRVSGTLQAPTIYWACLWYANVLHTQSPCQVFHGTLVHPSRGPCLSCTGTSTPFGLLLGPPPPPTTRELRAPYDTSLRDSIAPPVLVPYQGCVGADMLNVCIQLCLLRWQHGQGLARTCKNTHSKYQSGRGPSSGLGWLGYRLPGSPRFSALKVVHTRHFHRDFEPKINRRY